MTYKVTLTPEDIIAIKENCSTDLFKQVELKTRSSEQVDIHHVELTRVDIVSIAEKCTAKILRKIALQIAGTALTDMRDESKSYDEFRKSKKAYLFINSIIPVEKLDSEKFVPATDFYDQVEKKYAIKKFDIFIQRYEQFRANKYEKLNGGIGEDISEFIKSALDIVQHFPENIHPTNIREILRDCSLNYCRTSLKAALSSDNEPFSKYLYNEIHQNLGIGLIMIEEVEKDIGNIEDLKKNFPEQSKILVFFKRLFS